MQKNYDEELLVRLRVDPNYDEPILHQILRIAVYDEYHAYETYKKVIEKFGQQQPFVNIMQAEIRHFEALTPLLQKYEVAMPVNDWEDKIEVPNSLLEAYELGVGAEIDNIKMYDNLIAYAKEYPDILDMLYRLQAASYNNHLPAFRQSVAAHAHNSFDLNKIYEQFAMAGGEQNSADAQEQMGAKVDELNAFAAKFAQGNVSQEDVMKILSNTNLSFVGGTLLGAVGAMLVAQTVNKSSDD